jgi:hypothetical protein
MISAGHILRTTTVKVEINAFVATLVVVSTRLCKGYFRIQYSVSLGTLGYFTSVGRLGLLEPLQRW